MRQRWGLIFLLVSETTKRCCHRRWAVRGAGLQQTLSSCLLWRLMLSIWTLNVLFYNKTILYSQCANCHSIKRNVLYCIFENIWIQIPPDSLPLLYCFDDEKGTVDALVRDWSVLFEAFFNVSINDQGFTDIDRRCVISHADKDDFSLNQLS